MCGSEENFCPWKKLILGCAWRFCNVTIVPGLVGLAGEDYKSSYHSWDHEGLCTTADMGSYLIKFSLLNLYAWLFNFATFLNLCTCLILTHDKKIKNNLSYCATFTSYCTLSFYSHYQISCIPVALEFTAEEATYSPYLSLL